VDRELRGWIEPGQKQNNIIRNHMAYKREIERIATCGTGGFLVLDLVYVHPYKKKKKPFL
jgi:hypothetical protein